MADKEKPKDSSYEIKTRLNNNEFRELIPFLKLDELFIIQVKLGDSWSYLYKLSNRDKSSSDTLTCSVCNVKLTYKAFKSHLKNKEHNDAINEVIQFYHPIYTYAKKFENLAKGDEVSEEELKEAIAAADESRNNASKSLYSQAKRIARLIEDLEIDQKKANLENDLIEFALKLDMKDDSRIFLEVALSLEELIKVEFTKDFEQWNKMLTTSGKPSITGKYFCHICLKNCAGIITVNAHLNGNLHKLHQSTVKAMRLASNEKVTKYFVFRYDAKQKISIRRNTKTALLKKMEAALKEKEEKEEKESFDKTVIQIKKEPLDEVEKDGKSQQLEIDDVNMIDIAKIKLEVNEGNSKIVKNNNKIKLSKEIASKAKLLVKQFNKEFTMAEKTCEMDNEGLLGLEYVLKIMKTPDDKNPMYECCLCDFSVNESRMQGHLMGYNHRLKYCEMHYPDTMTLYKDRIGHLKYHEFYRIMGIVLSRLSSAIEKHHGLGSPFDISYSYFSKNREEVTLAVYGLTHASQHKGPSFSNVITTEDILKIKRNKDSYEPIVVPSDHPARFVKVQTKNYEKYRLKIKEKKERERDRNRNRSRERERELERERERDKEKSRIMRSKSPRRERPISRSRSRSEKQASSPRHRLKRSSNNYAIPKRPKDLWKLYREQITTAAIAVERAYMDYRKNPESHPSYDEEWNRYWRRRKEELQAQGIDHRSYNFQPEWVLYFRERLEQLFGEDLQNSKIDVRKNLNIPLDAEEDSEDFITSTRGKSNSKEPPYKKFCYSEEDVLESKISTLPDSKPNIIHALRLMTALEDHLGSLGSKIMQLLSNALTLEKTFSNNLIVLEQKILTPSNCTLLETAMEKLKGILYAGLLESSKIQAFNKVIENTTHLLKHADDMGWRYEVEKPISLQTNLQPTNSQTPQMNPKELQQLIDVMQNKRSDVFSLKQKSLSETLMDLISLQRNANEPTPAVAAVSQNRSPKRSNYSGGQNYNGNQGNRTGFSNSMGDQNANDKIRQQNEFYPNNPKRNDINQGNINSNNIPKFNTNLNRNASYDFPNRSLVSSGSNANESGIGVFNNMNYPNQNSTATTIGNMSHMRSGEGIIRNDNFVNRTGSQVNTGQNFNNINRPAGFYQSAFGIGSDDNWGHIQNNPQLWQQSSQNQQGSQQFRNK